MTSDFDYALDVDPGNQGFDDDEFEWDNPRPNPGPMFNRRFKSGYNMNAQYSEAFGDYRGGYGPGGGFGVPRPRPYPPSPLRGRGFGPMGPSPVRGRGSGPMGPPRRGPPIHRAAHFLADCEVAPQYIKILPWELLDMINPEYCGLCSQPLDSFLNAKIHYNCKRHYKAQKKFMALNKPNNNKSEVPLKARNLYCELCDVHLTSASHADSHYSGKSHHAIVDGRKPPKNSILLQSGMEDRVAQLIRREKKNFKTVTETAKVVENVIDRNLPPELICEICKTSVTCSEQMTNHLNGKRHLAKEKQHILKMMKGEADKKNVDENKSEDTVAAEAGEADAADPEDNDDWTSGGGFGWDSQNGDQSTTEVEQ